MMPPVTAPADHRAWKRVMIDRPTLPLQLDRLGVHRDVGEAVEGTEDDEGAEHEERRWCDAHQRQRHGQPGRRHERHRAASEPVDEPAAQAARGEASHAGSDERDAEGGVGDARGGPGSLAAVASTRRTSPR